MTEDMANKMHPVRILLVEDNAGDARLLRVALQRKGGPGFQITHVMRLAEATESLLGGQFDLIILDLSLPDSDGLDTVSRVCGLASHTAIIVLTSQENETLAIEAARQGAQDYLIKGQTESPLLLRAVRYAIERKRVQEEKERLEDQNRKLQKSESLGRMAGAIAHHFNNQLMAVIGNLELALDGLPRDAGSFETLTDAMQAALRASEVSRLMLTYLGQMVGKLEPLDLSSACQLSLPMFKAVMPKNVALECELPSPGPVVIGNANQIQQVLGNLVTNAWEAGDGAPGVVRLSVKKALPSDISELYRFPIDAQARHTGYACLEVTDTGCGIAPEDMEKLFDPFFSSKFTGRGLGLAVVIGVLRAHEGIITVESEVGSGSIFRVYFPLVPDAIPLQSGKPGQIRDIQKGGTVLVVEDEKMVRKVAVAMLTRMGFTVLAAKDGMEAVNLFRQHTEKIRSVLCDLSMPRMNGWATLTALRQIKPGIPVVLASGYSEEQVMDGEHPILPQAFVAKPYQSAKLCEAVRKALATEKDNHHG